MDKKYNWSKIPFSELEQGGLITDSTIKQITKSFEKYAKRISKMGYNTITIDDLAHLIIHSFYSHELKQKIETYQKLYQSVFSVAEKYELKILITTDVVFFNQSIIDHTKMKHNSIFRFFARSIRRLYKQFPQIAGIVLRVGESDGIDVEGDFHSQLVIRKIEHCRKLLRTILPICDEYEKLCIFRTWTLGAFQIGDLMWNKETYHQTFDYIDSENLVISFKFGESDFFRHLNFNPLFYEPGHKKILELQTRREYEGFGQFPSFVGNDYERYSRYLTMGEEVVGISVWCQTGGWSHFNQLTFLKNSSLWNEINTYATIKIFKEGLTADKAVKAFVQEYFPKMNPSKMIKLLNLSERVIKELWYIPEFSKKRIYFRRTRIPSLIWIFWDSILINHSIRKIIRRFVHERREAVQDGYRSLLKIKKMKKIAKDIGLDAKPFDFMYDTFYIIALGREYYLGKYKSKLSEKIDKAAKNYQKKYPQGFHVETDFRPVKFKKWLVKMILRLTFRMHPHYRPMDKLFFLRFAALVYPLIRGWQKRRFPEFAKEQAMGIQVLFK